MSLTQNELFYLDSFYANSVVAIGAAAIQVFMWGYMLCIVTELPKQARNQRISYMIISFLLVTLSCIMGVCRGHVAFRVIYKISPSTEDIYTIINDEYASVLSLVDDTSFRILRWIADGLLLHRCFIVWYDRKWVVLFPLSLYLVAMGISIRLMVPAAADDDRLALYYSLNVFITLGVNILVTVLISVRLIRHKKLISILPGSHGKVYTKIIVVLVESAAPLTIFGIGYAVSNVILGGMAWRVSVSFLIGYNTFVALSPQLIIFRVAVGRSWSNHSESITLPNLKSEINFIGHTDTMDTPHGSTIEQQKEYPSGDLV